MQRHSEEQVSDEDLRKALIISSDPGEHLERIREVEKLPRLGVVAAPVTKAARSAEGDHEPRR
jgi:hypothetical protein